MARKNYNKVYGYNKALDGWSNMWQNNVTYLHYYYFLKELAINMYKWEVYQIQLTSGFRVDAF